jgi:CRISPR/Cas system-associated exonuclease Cas4 (RecB family)
MATKKVIPIKPITAWSFSRYSTYKQCPLKLKLSAIDKINEPPNEPMARGARIHNLAEDFIKGKVPKLAPELKLFDKEFKRLRTMFKKISQSMVVEDNWAFTKDWDETSWDNWTACWVRIKLDCAHHESYTTLVVTDWKTGKFRAEMNEEYVEQLELYALSALLLHEHVEEVRPRLAYTDLGKIYPNGTDEPELVYTRADIPRLKKLWEKRVKPMMNDTIFAPRPNSKCKWCFYGQAGKVKGGPGICKY